MAEQRVIIPDGEFCSDNKRLGCVYELHERGFHSCLLFNEDIGEIQEFTVNGKRQRAFRKCKKCLETMICDGGHGIKVDK